MQCSPSTFLRAMHKAALSSKKIVRSHLLCDDNLGLEFLERISHIIVNLLIDIDETSSTPESFYQKKGWAPVGDECTRTQIIIGTRTFSTIAAVSPLGYLCWEIFEGLIIYFTWIAVLNNTTVYTTVLLLIDSGGRGECQWCLRFDALLQYAIIDRSRNEVVLHPYYVMWIFKYIIITLCWILLLTVQLPWTQSPVQQSPTTVKKRLRRVGKELLY